MIIKANKFRHFKSVTAETLEEIKDIHQGILTIEKSECRGSDTRFAKDARVLITATPEDFNEYL